MGEQNRKNVRFRPTPGTVVQIDHECKSGEFRPSINALAINESFKGVGFVIISTEILKVNQKLRVKVGNLHPMDCCVRWVKTLDEDICRAGVEYLNQEEES